MRILNTDSHRPFILTSYLRFYETQVAIEKTNPQKKTTMKEHWEQYLRSTKMQNMTDGKSF